MTTANATRLLPHLARLVAVGAVLAAPAFAQAATTSTIALGDPETYALMAASFGMVVFMAGRRGGR